MIKVPRFKTHIPYDDYYTMCGLPLDKFITRLTSDIEKANCGNCIRKKSIFHLCDNQKMTTRRKKRYENTSREQSSDIIRETV